MSNINAIFANAVAEHGKGNLARARLLYLQVVKAQPRNAEALLRLGVTCLQDGKTSDALSWFTKAASAQPAMAAAHSNMGVVLRRLGRLNEAVQAYAKAVELAPADATFRVNLGNALQTAGRLDDAEGQFKAAIQLAPDQAGPWVALGTLYMAAARWDLAEQALTKAVAMAPSSNALANLSLVVHESPRDQEALDLALRAVRLDPNDPLAAKALGIAQSPFDPDESARWLRRALELDPNQSDAWNALGNREGAAGNPQAAITCYDKAIQVGPNNRDARMNRSRAQLLLGRWLDAWPDYEHRWGTAMTAPYLAERPRWTGEDFRDRTLLVHCEQGLGDSIQFLRYLPLVKAHGGRVIMGIQPELIRLIDGLPEVDQVAPVGQPMPPFDLQVPLLSLPGIFGTHPGNIPPVSPLAQPDQTLKDRWAAQLPRNGGLNVGLVWAGNPGFKADKERSPGLDMVARILDVPGVNFISLQKGPGAQQLAGHPKAGQLIDLGSKTDDFADTAAIMAGLDLVISSCTAPLHMAATVGTPTWAMLPFVPDWRWMLGSTDTPWYPNLRLYRQPRRYDWDSVLRSVVTDLTDLASRRA